jgi:hypothetical protein
MSNRYKGAIISATPPTTSGGESGVASGAWTLEQQMQLTAAGLWPIQPLPKFIEDVFSTYLYTGTGANLTITNNIDLSTNGGLVWIKIRSASGAHRLFDTARGATKYLASNSTSSSAIDATSLTAFNSTGFSLGNNDAGDDTVNGSTYKYASWTFRKQPKFFDIVTYTGNGTAGRQIAHSLGSTPGCIMVKRTSGSETGGIAGWWSVYHRGLSTPQSGAVFLNTTDERNGGGLWDNTLPTSTNFTLGSSYVNYSGDTYVAYIFAHDAGGFGLTGTDNVISCGSYTGNGSTSGPTVTLGYEPQWVMIKSATAATYNNWFMFDTMRGISYGSGDAYLYANLNNAETTGGEFLDLTATGFNLTKENVCNESGVTYIYIAIRRGPMKVPTTGTSVYKAITYNGVGTAGQVLTGSGFPIDLAIAKCRSTDSGFNFTFMDRLRGGTAYVFSNTTGAEGNTAGYYIRSFDMDGVTYGTAYGDYTSSAGSPTYVLEGFRRAPSFFDEVCYTGNGTGGRTVSHNLTVAPEMIIAKNRSGAANPWLVFTQPTGNSGVLVLNATDALTTPYFNWTPTSTTFSVGAQGFASNDSGVTYVAYLFATCAGVSKVGSYTGTAATLQIDCGFTGGARFVLIKRTDSTGAWYVWDTARGIVSGNDPYLLLNSTAAEVTSTDYIDPYSAGFEISSTAPAAINASAGTYIFLAIA